LKKTDNLSNIPNDFAIEFLPSWIFFGKKITYDSLKNNKNPFKIFWQTLSISIATKANSSDNDSSSSEDVPSGDTTSDKDSRSLSLGVRFSLIRGKLLHEGKYEEIVKDINTELSKKITEDEDLKDLRQQRRKLKKDSNEWKKIVKKMEKRNEEIEEEVTKLFYEKAPESNPLKRIGLNLNIAGGVVWKFEGTKFEKGKLNKWGLWTTLSYEMKKVNLLAVGRYLSMEEDEDSIKKHCFDFGGRIIFDSLKKYSLSGELLYRKYNRNEDEANTSQWRAALLFEYRIGKNQTIYFSVGRDFEGNENSNLVSMIGLKLGIGSERFHL
jgi:hypothetical protein